MQSGNILLRKQIGNYAISNLTFSTADIALLCTESAMGNSLPMLPKSCTHTSAMFPVAEGLRTHREAPCRKRLYAHLSNDPCCGRIMDSQRRSRLMEYPNYHYQKTLSMRLIWHDLLCLFESKSCSGSTCVRLSGREGSRNGRVRTILFYHRILRGLWCESRGSCFRT